MYRNTRFGDLLKAFPRNQFQRCVDRHGGDKHSKGFRCWDQLMGMMYGQLSGSTSLRELEVGYNSQARHHYHLGSRRIRRSTLSDANARRPYQVYEDFCQELVGSVHGRLRRELKGLLYLLDSTPIQLLGRGYDWTRGRRQPHIKGLKLHVVYASQESVPVMTQLTASNVNDIEVGREILLERGATYVFDKGYCDYTWWHLLNEGGCRFVTRLKQNASIEEVSIRNLRDEDTVLPDREEVLSDTEIRLANRYPGGGRVNPYRETLRRLEVRVEGHKSPLVLVTNDFDSDAREIRALYRQRWAIELWFKWLKQRLKVKRFVGCSENAVKIQVYIALITYLLLYRYRQWSGDKGETFHLWLEAFRATMFMRIDDPYGRYRERQRRRKAALHAQASLLA